MTHPTLEQVKNHFKNARKINTALYKEHIDLKDYDLNSIDEHGGRFYITHKDDLDKKDSEFLKRKKCLYHKETGFAVITHLK